MSNKSTGDLGYATAQLETQMADYDKRRAAQTDAPPVVTGDAVAAAVLAVEGELPKGTMETIALLKKYQAMPVKTKLEVRVKFAVLERVRKHYRELSNGPSQGSHTDACHDMHRMAADSVANAPGRRAAKIERLQALSTHLGSQANDIATGTGVSPVAEPIALNPIAALAHSPRTQGFLLMTRLSLIAWEIQRLTNFEFTNPDERARELAHELEQTSDADAIRNLQAQISALRMPECANIRSRCKRELNVVFEAFTTDLAHLKVSAIEALNGFRNLALIHEDNFFGGFNLPSEATAVSRRYDTAMKQVHAIQPSKDALKIFGLNDLA